MCQCNMCGPVGPPPHLILGGFVCGHEPNPRGTYVQDPYAPVPPAEPNSKRPRTTYVSGALGSPCLESELNADAPIDHNVFEQIRRGKPTNMRTELQSTSLPGYKAQINTTSNDVFDVHRGRPFVISLVDQWHKEVKERMQSAAAPSKENHTKKCEGNSEPNI